MKINVNTFFFSTAEKEEFAGDIATRGTARSSLHLYVRKFRKEKLKKDLSR